MMNARQTEHTRSVHSRFMDDIDALIGHDTFERAQLALTLRQALAAPPNDRAWQWLYQQTRQIANRRNLGHHDHAAHRRIHDFLRKNRDLG